MLLLLSIRTVRCDVSHNGLCQVMHERHLHTPACQPSALVTYALNKQAMMLSTLQHACISREQHGKLRYGIAMQLLCQHLLTLTPLSVAMSAIMLMRYMWSAWETTATTIGMWAQRCRQHACSQGVCSTAVLHQTVLWACAPAMLSGWSTPLSTQPVRFDVCNQHEQLSVLALAQIGRVKCPPKTSLTPSTSAATS